MVRRALGNHHVGPDTLLVTSDLAKQTDTVADETEYRGELTDLVRGARYVLFDFDGPICRLFAGRPAEWIAREQVAWLDAQGLGDALTREERADSDPHSALRSLGLQRPSSDLVVEMEKRLTDQELQAVPTAWPTPYADPLIRTWSAVGARLAITTNNSPEVARRYLEGRGLSACFEPHIYGRTQDLERLKPDPYCLNRALNAMGAAHAATLMIGDTPTDLRAAEAAGVAFLGYARNEDKKRTLREAGASQVVESLEGLLRILQNRS
ncbi:MULTISPECIES: HAD family hydrolase [unclassified Streptomyces]|uniref:HAD family hydrolase n=1 Tax=unclassified Streptomyces TaxID=2593676 RepID=UPI000DB9EA4B|nr:MULTISPECIES: HAD family hydrolase [unclassified Streptomyces]MYT72297.1 HAD hydrolase-like protein [Streptomyces sp. SID8367]RAJ81712.1 HAD superfamily hydrolase (TIGR01509 family) [Streptomyces sp. PsTaAH-137]